MYLRRGRVVGRSFAAVLTHISTVVTPPAHAAQILGVGLMRLFRGQALSRRSAIQPVCKSRVNFTGFTYTAAVAPLPSGNRGNITGGGHAPPPRTTHQNTIIL
jgi:hypothetical protein